MLQGLLTLCVFTIGAFNESDTIPRRLYIGFEQGISLRYFFPTNFGSGLLIQQAGTSLYDDFESNNKSSYNYRINESHNESKEKGVQLNAVCYYRKKLGTMFWITPYVSLGGSYSYFKRIYRSSFIQNDSTAMNYYSKDGTKYTTYSFLGGIGLMPGIQIGRFQIEIKLGMNGSYIKRNSPEEMERSENSNQTRLKLKYPSDFVRSIIIHFGF